MYIYMNNWNGSKLKGKLMTAKEEFEAPFQNDYADSNLFSSNIYENDGDISISLIVMKHQVVNMVIGVLCLTLILEDL